jgi:hypothetical protein
MGNLSEHVGVRLNPSDKKLLVAVCDARGEDVSNFIRRLVRRELASLNYFPEDVKKAFGLTAGLEVN